MRNFYLTIRENNAGHMFDLIASEETCFFGRESVAASGHDFFDKLRYARRKHFPRKCQIINVTSKNQLVTAGIIVQHIKHRPVCVEGQNRT